jgi:hypothetical protein
MPIFLIVLKAPSLISFLPGYAFLIVKAEDKGSFKESNCCFRFEAASISSEKIFKYDFNCFL